MLNFSLKNIVVFITLITMLSFNTLDAFSAEKGFVNCDVLNVRTSPTTDSEVVNKLSNGQSFDIIYTDNGWYNILLDSGLTGFVSAEFVTKEMLVDTYNDSAADKIIDLADNFIGYPYSYGSSGPRAFDCSGFTSYVYKSCGYTLPRTSRDQGSCGTFVDKENINKGDLLFFSNRRDRVINHVGIYMGEGKFIHASTNVRGVVVDDLSTDYYVRNYVGARRVL